MKVLYLAHDLADAAIRRRVRFLQEGGALVRLVGFSRVRNAGAHDGTSGRLIGITRNGRLVRRIVSTAAAVLLSGRWHDEMRAADIILARSLEMLVIAVLVRARLRLGKPIIYECLDIHRLMTGNSLPSLAMRRIEQRLLNSCALLIVSSPRFIDAYFEPAHRRLPPWILLENKVLASELQDGATSCQAGSPRPDGPPWRIGWFGIIRCRRSLLLLASLVRGSSGTIEVEIRGRPARDVIPEFDAVVAATPGMRFGGGYDRAIDLPGLYMDVHFNWTLDFYEAGLNSEWLLPNRLYEGSMFGAVPLALASVETGRWFARQGCGVLLEEPLQPVLDRFFAGLDAGSYQSLQAAVGRIDRMALMESADSAAQFVDTLRGLHRRDAPHGQSAVLRHDKAA
ncbi:glycosyl transferase family 1 [Lichenicola sp.]|uniref:glycosyl transferase family 1 n=1 Tax=Lichenicola sp. TaxID=2804529 RepID=UPI003B00B9FF